MIRPSKKLKEFAETFKTQETFGDFLGFDEATISKVFSGERGASTNFIKAVIEKIGLKFEEAFDVDGKPE